VFINILKKEVAGCKKYTSLNGVIYLKSTVKSPVIFDLLIYVAV